MCAYVMTTNYSVTKEKAPRLIVNLSHLTHMQSDVFEIQFVPFFCNGIYDLVDCSFRGKKETEYTNTNGHLKCSVAEKREKGVCCHNRLISLKIHSIVYFSVKKISDGVSPLKVIF